MRRSFFFRIRELFFITLLHFLCFSLQAQKTDSLSISTKENWVLSLSQRLHPERTVKYLIGDELRVSTFDIPSRRVSGILNRINQTSMVIDNDTFDFRNIAKISKTRSKERTGGGTALVMIGLTFITGGILYKQPTRDKPTSPNYVSETLTLIGCVNITGGALILYNWGRSAKRWQIYRGPIN